ncbi:hypothetical protein [Roseovarius atlanticus]|uniref:hypothetical protein n=1 Tax=Roseovarius atlanticus TaxID=1641875 RepID=UPI001C95D59A|nr:hypothetical protein [Roseovarius atlanticus]MBY5986348.1 hypothetical protein [Roseovarius atlanticus]MBY6124988.1 hypothetical protein [Roseovarius atlanticus]MBY6150551.1 hypothetical protein [Roseovarius atlanticus]
MRRLIAFSATALLLSSAAMADDTAATDPDRDIAPDDMGINSAGFLFDDSLSANDDNDRDARGDDDDDRTEDDRKNDDSGKGRNTPDDDDHDAEDEDDKPDD